MEIYCSFNYCQTTDVELVKKVIVGVLEENSVAISLEDIFFEVEFDVYILLVEDTQFQNHKQIKFILNLLSTVSKRLKAKYSVFKLPDINLIQTIYN